MQAASSAISFKSWVRHDANVRLTIRPMRSACSKSSQGRRGCNVASSDVASMQQQAQDSMWAVAVVTGVDEEVVAGLMTEIQSGSAEVQVVAAEQIR